jgi:hypothetical protein
VAEAGFHEIEVQKVAGERPMDSIPAEIARYQAMPQVTPLFAGLDEATRARAWDEVAQRWRDAGPTIPLELLVVGATR